MIATIMVLIGGSLLGGEDARQDIDIYGGHLANRAVRTGSFHMEKIGPQWMFIAPEGNGLYPTGNHVRP